MLSVVELNDILDSAEDLAEKRQFRVLLDHLESIPEDLIASDTTALYLLGYAKYMTGDEVSARTVIESAARVYRFDQNTRLRRRMLNLRAIIEIEQGRLSAGEALLLDLRALAATANDQKYVAFATLNLGISAQIRGEAETAISEYRRAGAAFQCLGDLSGLAGCAHNLGMLCREIGQYVAADRSFLQARGYFEAHDDLEELVTTDIERSALMLLTGELDMAGRTASFGLRKAEEMGNRRLRGEALRVLGMVDIRKNRFESAAIQLEEALEIAESNDIPFLQAEVHTLLYRAVRGIGNSGAALEHLKRAQRLFINMGAPARAHRLKDSEQVWTDR